MILSALLTSVGINFALCVIFFALYSILKKQPNNFPVYAPRMLQQEQQPSTSHRIILFRFLPSVSWVKAAWQTSEDDILTVAGLDGVVFIRIFVFSIKVFTVGVIIGLFVLLPVNFFGNQLTADISNLPTKSLDTFSVSNVKDGSNWLWFHFCAAYVFTGAVCYFLYYEYNHISNKRIDCFYASKPLPSQFTVFVGSVPTTDGKSYKEAVESFFTEYYPTTYLSNSVVFRSNRMHHLMNQTKKINSKIAELKANSHLQEKSKRTGCLGILGPKVSIMSYYETELQKLGEKVREERNNLRNKELSASFVTFKSRFAATMALKMQQGVNPTKWVTEEAAEPNDIHWQFFSSSFMGRWVHQIISVTAYVFTTILFLAPVVFVQGLANLNQLKILFPFLDGILKIAFVSQFITGYLPSLILQGFLHLVPSFMITLSTFKGYTSINQIERDACVKMLFFTLWNIFFADSLSGSVLYNIEVFLDPKHIPSVLADAVTAQASFFISYVVTSGWTGLASELVRLFPLIWTFIQRVTPGEDKFSAPPISYHVDIPNVLLFVLLGVVFFFLAPLILPFILVYFCFGYIIFVNQLVNVYQPIYDTRGKYWRYVHNSTIFSLALMHVIAFGIFGVKKLGVAATLIVPLPILTLIFNDYCRKRFGPIFHGYPTECLVRKDREDEDDASMREFYDMLGNAYEDPALRYVHHGINVEAPLLGES